MAIWRRKEGHLPGPTAQVVKAIKGKSDKGGEFKMILNRVDKQIAPF